MPKQSCSATSFSRISSASRQVLILKTGGASTKQWEDEHSILSQNCQLKKFVRLTMPKLCSFSFCSHFLLLLLPPLCFHLSCDVGPGAQAAKKLWIFGTSGSNGERVLQTAVEGAEAATGCGSVRRGCSLTARLPARHFVIEMIPPGVNTLSVHCSKSYVGQSERWLQPYKTTTHDLFGGFTSASWRLNGLCNFPLMTVLTGHSSLHKSAASLVGRDWNAQGTDAAKTHRNK